MKVYFKPGNPPAIRIGSVLCDKEGEYDLPESVLTDYPNLFSAVGSEKSSRAPEKNESAAKPPKNKAASAPDKNK